MGSNKVSTSFHYLKRSTSEDSYWVPNTDVYVTDSGLVIKVELAGLRKEELQLTIERNQLRISGSRPDGCRAAKCTFLVMEIDYGEFETTIELPAGYDLGEAKATYQNGFLRIDVPKSDPPAPAHGAAGNVREP